MGEADGAGAPERRLLRKRKKVHVAASLLLMTSRAGGFA